MKGILKTRLLVLMIGGITLLQPAFYRFILGRCGENADGQPGPIPIVPSFFGDSNLSIPKPSGWMAHLPAVEVLEEIRVPDVEEPRRVRTRRLIRTDFKYPLIILEQTHLENSSISPVFAERCYVADHVVMRLEQSGEETAALAAIGRDATVLRRFESSGVLLIGLKGRGLTVVEKAIEGLRASGISAVAEPDYLGLATRLPNDARFPEQWNLRNTGQTGGKPGADVRAMEGWNIGHDAPGVAVGIVDSGIDFSHSDLQPNQWTNPAEAAGLPGVDDDENGYVDDIYGWDFYDNDAGAGDIFGHGTHCAGIVGASGNNAAGVSGICWNVKLAALKWLGDNGVGVASDAVEAIAYASRMGIAVTSNSWHLSGPSEILRQVVAESGAHGSLFVCAAANRGANVDRLEDAPVTFRLPNMLVVTSVNATDSFANGANWGPLTVQLAAPGVDVLSTLPGGQYGLLTGTSMAAPHVAGACALLKSLHPDFSISRIRDVVLESARPLPSLIGRCETGGTLDLGAALSAAAGVGLSPRAGVEFAGKLGGPFQAESPPEYALLNPLSVPVHWDLTGLPVWLSASSTSGTLGPGQTVAVVFSTTVAAGALPAGQYEAEVSFASDSSDYRLFRRVRLVCGSVATLPFSDSFEPAQFAPWWSFTGRGPRRSEVAVVDGGRRLVLDSAGDGSYATNEATLSLDLEGYEEALLSFSLKSGEDEANAPPASPFRGSADFDGIAVSVDGQNWYEVFSLRDRPRVWTRFTVDLAAGLRARGLVPAAKTRIRFNQYDNHSFPIDGLLLDDIQVTGVPSQRLRFGSAVEVSEGGPPVLLRISLPRAQAGAVAVNLHASSSDQLTVPVQLMVPVGATFAEFAGAAIDDALLDGTQNVTLTATADGFDPAELFLPVHDNESVQIGVGLPASVSENAGTLTGAGSVSLARAVDRTVTIHLASSGNLLEPVPESLIIPAGASSAAFAVKVTDNNLVNGPRAESIRATVTGWISGEASTTVVDDEAGSLHVELPLFVNEADGVLPGAGRVVANLAPAGALVVSLSGSPGLGLPATVTIPAGARSADFDVAPADNHQADGPRVVQVSATTPGWASGNASFTMVDDESPLTPYSTGLDVAVPGTGQVRLGWGIAAGEQIGNGGFEQGGIEGWQVQSRTPAVVVLGAAARTGGAGCDLRPAGVSRVRLLHRIRLPMDGRLPVLTWAWRGLGPGRVEVGLEESDGTPVAVLQSQEVAISDWAGLSADLSRWRGRLLQLVFDVGAPLWLDDVSLDLGPPRPGTHDVIVQGLPAGTTPGFSMEVTRPPNSELHWQVRRKEGALFSMSPLFTLALPAAAGALDHHAVFLNSQRILPGVPVPVEVKAFDSAGNQAAWSGALPLSLRPSLVAQLGYTVEPASIALVNGAWSGTVVLRGPPSETLMALQAGTSTSQGFLFGAAGGRPVWGLDPDGDGCSNLIELALGSLPGQAGSRPPSPVLTRPAEGRLRIEYSATAPPAGVDCFLETSTDLEAWTPALADSRIGPGFVFELPWSERPLFLRLKAGVSD